MSKPFLKDCLWNVDTNDKDIYFSFDDGPDPRSTPVILDLLDKHNAKGVFFLIGSRVQVHPKLVNEISKRGHVVGNHSYHHRDPWKTKKEDLIGSFERNQLLLESILSIDERIPVRPPFGHLTRGLLDWTKRKKLDVIMWDLDPCDYLSGQIYEDIAQRILGQSNKGSIVLMHDREDLIKRTSEALDEALTKLAADGWGFPRIASSRLLHSEEI